jgi:low temperature requirement protein LtrA
MKGLVVPEQTEDYSADPVELFFDLAFVFAFSQLVGLLIHEPNWTGAGKAALLFGLLWLPWSQFTWSANTVPGNNRAVRVIFLLATAASVPMAAAVTTAFDEGGAAFAIPLGMISLAGIGLLVLGAERGSQNYRAVLTYSLPTVVAFLTIIVGGFLEDEARVAAWIVGLLIFVGSTVVAGSGEWAVRAGHFAERHALILIVALGEVIVAIATPLVASLEEGEGLSSATVLALIAAGLFAGLLWWAYFDRPQPALEYGLDRSPLAAKGRYARDVYTYGHMPIVAGVIAAAAALEEVTLHPQDPLPLDFRVMMFIGLVLFFGGVGIDVFRAWRAVARERIAGGVLTVVLLLAAADLDGVVLVLLVDLLILLVLIAENWRIERLGSAATAPTDP